MILPVDQVHLSLLFCPALLWLLWFRPNHSVPTHLLLMGSWKKKKQSNGHKFIRFSLQTKFNYAKYKQSSLTVTVGEAMAVLLRAVYNDTTSNITGVLVLGFKIFVSGFRFCPSYHWPCLSYITCPSWLTTQSHRSLNRSRCYFKSDS